MKTLIPRWSAPGGYAEALRIAIPLILSTGSWSIQHFVDRMFLAWYSPEAIAASMPSGILNFTVMSLFIGTSSYVNTFVAQYYGAGKYERIGPAVWQGMYFSVLAMLFMVACIPFAGPLFDLGGHPPAVREMEVAYFVVLCCGGFFPVASSAMSGFFTGLGLTWNVMWINFTATGINVLLDYCMIFGNFGFPEMGIRGAAIATVISSASSCVIFLLLMLKARYRDKYHTWSGRRLDTALLRRLLRYGFPNGVQFFLDILGFTFFIMLVGRYGLLELAATNIAFNINTLAFMPMMGMAIAVSVMVGHNLGNRDPQRAEYSTWSAAHICFGYMIVISLGYVLVPGLFLRPFGMKSDPQDFEQIYAYGVVLLRFVALYSIFDTFNLIFASAIKGAGDTRFVMKAIVIASWTLMVIPTYLAIVVFHWPLYAAWGCATTYVIVLGFVFLWRFLKGHWKQMLVIEETPNIPASVILPENPVPE